MSTIKPTQPAAPRHLSVPSRALWRAILAEYTLETHHRELLRLALEALDRCEEARRQIAADGPTVAGRYSLIAHPAIAIERDSAIRAARLLRELGLDIPPPVDHSIYREKGRVR